jgi:25S rRNA (uracil2634-N3)-methyltransferase
VRVHWCSNPNPLNAGLYKRSQRILLVGEGDFSFTLALATVIGGSGIVATSYDSASDVATKYPSATDVLGGIPCHVHA